ncbi:MAG: hypothetical protein RJQ14_03625 [Marinoscillum sp.]
MKRKLISSVLFMLIIFGLQQSLVRINKSSATLNQQIDMIKKRDLDPAMLFYTESDEAMRAEKEVRQKIN